MNLIGEHTDYNAGLALPFAIDRGVTVTAEPLAGDRIEARALDLGEEDEFALAAPERAEGWRAFVRGAVAELQAAGHDAAARAADDRERPRRRARACRPRPRSRRRCASRCLPASEPADRVELAKLCSRVENDWVGAETGLLDQLAALCGEPGHAVRIDFALARDRARAARARAAGRWSRSTPAPTHTHAGSGYNERRRECREACARARRRRRCARPTRDSTACPSRCAPAPATC